MLESVRSESAVRIKAIPNHGSERVVRDPASSTTYASSELREFSISADLRLQADHMSLRVNTELIPLEART